MNDETVHSKIVDTGRGSDLLPVAGGEGGRGGVRGRWAPATVRARLIWLLVFDLAAAALLLALLWVPLHS
jgi:hypothetical protein